MAASGCKNVGRDFRQQQEGYIKEGTLQCPSSPVGRCGGVRAIRCATFPHVLMEDVCIVLSRKIQSLCIVQSAQSGREVEALGVRCPLLPPPLPLGGVLEVAGSTGLVRAMSKCNLWIYELYASRTHADA